LSASEVFFRSVLRALAAVASVCPRSRASGHPKVAIRAVARDPVLKSADVRFGSKADIGAGPPDVRFTPKADIKRL
jgi:hypothetical protein